MRKNNQDQLVQSISESNEGRFSHRSTHLLSMRKTEKALPNSPRKRNAVVSSLARKFQLRIMAQTNNRGRPKHELKTEKSSLLDFLDHPNITFTTPGKTDQGYIGQMYGKKLYKTKKYLLQTLNEVLDIANRCAATGIQCEDSFVSQFGRKVSIRQLYEFIKFNKLYIYNQNIPYATGLCEICENAAC